MRATNLKRSVFANPLTILFFVAVGGLMAYQWTHFGQKKYCATARIITAQQIPKITNQDSGIPGWWHKLEGDQSEAREFIAQFLNNPDLNVEYEAGSFPYGNQKINNTPIKVKYQIKNDQFRSQRFQLKPLDENEFELSYHFGGIRRIVTSVYGKPIHEKDLNLTILKKVEFHSQHAEPMTASAIEFTVYSPDAMADIILQTGCSITQSGSRVVVTAVHAIPEKAMQIANAIAGGIIQAQNQKEEILNRQIEELKTALTVNGIKAYQPLLGTSVFANNNLWQRMALEQERVRIMSREVSLENVSDYLRNNRYAGHVAPEFGVVADPAFANFIQSIYSKQAEASKAASEEDRKKINLEINELRNLLAESMRNTRKSTALQREAIEKAINSQDDKQASRLTRTDAEGKAPSPQDEWILAQKKYDLLLMKKSELDYQKENLLQGEKELTEASLPLYPESQSARFIWSLLLSAGFIFGIFISRIKNQFYKPRLGSKKRIEALTAIPCYTHLNKIKGNDHTFTAIAERIILSGIGKPESKLFNITSVQRGTGKSFFAMRMAKALAGIDKNVLLVDCETSSSSIAQQMGLTGISAFSEIFENKSDVHDCITRTDIPGMDVMCIGEISNASRLMFIRYFSDAIQQLKKSYDFIILDHEAFSGSLACLALMQLGDFNFIIENEKADAIKIINAVEGLSSDYHISNLSFVLNAAPRVNKKQQGSQTANKIQPEDQSNSPAMNKQPSFLKRAALWFY